MNPYIKKADTLCRTKPLSGWIHENAKAIPDLFTPGFLIIMMLLICGLSHPALGETEPKLFYARFDVKFSDNSIQKSNLILVPVENDFRAENFTLHTISGNAEASASNQKADIETRAKHNAIMTLLEKHGLKSVKSRSSSQNGSSKNDTVVSYEGCVKFPVRMIEHGYDKTTKRYWVKIEISFSPTAFPDRWKHLKFKEKIKQMTRDFFSLFK